MEAERDVEAPPVRVPLPAPAAPIAATLAEGRHAGSEVKADVPVSEEEKIQSQYADEHQGHERHLVERNGWLRALVLGANDGIVSTAALVLGVAAATPSRASVLTAGVAGLVAGALSMAVGEYTSVSSQRDTERADLERERWEHAAHPEHELNELTMIFKSRGLSYTTARMAALELHEGDAVAAHMREELGITEFTTARPLQAAVVSALSFVTGGMWPLIAAAATPDARAIRVPVVSVVATLTLAILGWVGARLGGANVVRAALRVVAGGVIAMGITAGVGYLVGSGTGLS
eukprot:jgi/Chlat1/6796/Chrsp51S06493